MSLRAQQCTAASWVIILTVESAPAWPPPACTCQPTPARKTAELGGCRFTEDVFGKGGEGSRRLMWTRRVECAGPSAFPTTALRLVQKGGHSYFIQRQFSKLKDPPVTRQCLPWGPRAAPAPVRGPSEDVYP
jgi:hypothetical protein